MDTKLKVFIKPKLDGKIEKNLNTKLESSKSVRLGHHWLTVNIDFSNDT